MNKWVSAGVTAQCFLNFVVKGYHYLCKNLIPPCLDSVFVDGGSYFLGTYMLHLIASLPKTWKSQTILLM